jgi:hypothetical protein
MKSGLLNMTFSIPPSPLLKRAGSQSVNNLDLRRVDPDLLHHAKRDNLRPGHHSN